MTIEEQLKRERDSCQRQLDAIHSAIIRDLVQRIEPRMNRHPMTVVQHAGSIIARIGEAMACQFEDGDDLVAAVKELVRERDEARRLLELAHLGRAQLEGWRDGLERERDEARVEVERLRAEAAPMNEHFTAGYRDGYRDAYRRGAEAMREHIAEVAGRNAALEWVVELVRALPIPEEP